MRLRDGLPLYGRGSPLAERLTLGQGCPNARFCVHACVCTLGGGRIANRLGQGGKLGLHLCFKKVFSNRLGKRQLGELLLRRKAHIKRTLLIGFAALQNHRILCPAQLHGLRHKERAVFVEMIKITHPAKIAWGEAFSLRKLLCESFRQMHDKRFFALRADLRPHYGVELHQRAVCRSIRFCVADLSGGDNLLHINPAFIFKRFHRLLLSGSVEPV